MSAGSQSVSVSTTTLVLTSPSVPRHAPRDLTRPWQMPMEMPTQCTIKIIPAQSTFHCSQGNFYFSPRSVHYLVLGPHPSPSLDRLHPVVHRQPCPRRPPPQRALYEIRHDPNHIVDGSNQLFRRITFPVATWLSIRLSRSCLVRTAASSFYSESLSRQALGRVSKHSGRDLHAKSRVTPNGVPSSSLRA